MNGQDFNAGRDIGPEVLGLLLNRHAAALALYARQWCDCPEDTVQEAFVELAALRCMPDDVVAWLYRVVRNKAISAGRSRQRRTRHETEAAARRPMWFERSAGELLDAESAAEALGSLPSEQREIVVARIWGGLSFQQIGRLVGVSDSAAHRRYEGALSALRQKLRLPCPQND